MTKPQKFLLCENPMLTGDQSDRLFILHTRSPIILAEVFQFENMSEEERMDYERSITSGVVGRLDYPPETIFFEAITIINDDKLLQKSKQEQANELAGVMRRMADWYKAYLIWEDKQL